MDMEVFREKSRRGSIDLLFSESAEVHRSRRGRFRSMQSSPWDGGHPRAGAAHSDQDVFSTRVEVTPATTSPDTFTEAISACRRSSLRPLGQVVLERSSPRIGGHPSFGTPPSSSMRRSPQRRRLFPLYSRRRQIYNAVSRELEVAHSVAPKHRDLEFLRSDGGHPCSRVSP